MCSLKKIRTFPVWFQLLIRTHSSFIFLLIAKWIMRVKLFEILMHDCKIDHLPEFVTNFKLIMR